VRETVFMEITPGSLDYVNVIEEIQGAAIDVLYYAGYAPEAALLIRQLRHRGDDLQLVAGDALEVEDFWLIGREAADGTVFTSFRDPRGLPHAAELLAALRADNREPDIATFLAYAAMQAWAQAVEKAGTLEVDAVSKVLRSGYFDTVLGRIGFDEKGDVTRYEPFAWYVWKHGDYAPFDPVEPTE
jgi:branched-chain amino acid transport system substrate-binding protein